MREAHPVVGEQARGTVQNVDGFINHAQTVGAIMLTGLSLGAVGTAVKSFVGMDRAEAATPSTLVVSQEQATASSHQVEEYAKVTVKDTANHTISPFPKNTLVFLEQCRDGAVKVNRKVVATSSNQPLGECNIGSSVTVAAEKARSGDWKIESAPKQRVLKATRANNHHFIFVEQQENTPPPATSSSPTPQSPAPVNTNPGGGASNPGSGGGSTGGGGGTTGGGGGTPSGPYASGETGADISWAQCDGSGNASNTLQGSVANFSFGIVDLEDGLGYSANPCLASEVADFTMTGEPVSFYVNTGWYSGSAHVNPNSPNMCTPGDNVCLAYNYGYNNALYAVQVANSAGVSVTGKPVFRDLETDNTWDTGTNGQANSEQATENAASLQGTHDGLIASGASTSILYENQDAENEILDGEQDGEPIWFASGANTIADAPAYCSTTAPDGGSVVIVQANGETTTGTTGLPIDEDYVC